METKQLQNDSETNNVFPKIVGMYKELQNASNTLETYFTNIAVDHASKDQKLLAQIEKLTREHAKFGEIQDAVEEWFSKQVPEIRSAMFKDMLCAAGSYVNIPLLTNELLIQIRK